MDSLVGKGNGDPFNPLLTPVEVYHTPLSQTSRSSFAGENEPSTPNKNADESLLGELQAVQQFKNRINGIYSRDGIDPSRLNELIALQRFKERVTISLCFGILGILLSMAYWWFVIWMPDVTLMCIHMKFDRDATANAADQRVKEWGSGIVMLCAVIFAYGFCARNLLLEGLYQLTTMVKGLSVFLAAGFVRFQQSNSELWRQVQPTIKPMVEEVVALSVLFPIIILLVCIVWWWMVV